MLLLVVVACKKDTKSSSPIINKINSNKDQKGTFLTATINGKKFSSTVLISTFTANHQTYLLTADNFDKLEYAFKLIIKNDKDNDPKKIRYGFIGKEDENGKNITWKIPHNFDFTSTYIESGRYLEGTFSFTANAFNGISEDTTNQLVVTNGKFRAQ